MLRVLRHYLPIRKLLLMAGETLILTLVVALGLSQHLWQPVMQTTRLLALQGFSRDDALLRCFSGALVVSLLAQVALSFNELYAFRVSSSRYDRARRFIGSTGAAMGLVLLAAALARFWHLDALLAFPGQPFSQEVVSLVLSMAVGFALLYLWRNLFHWLLRKAAIFERVLILGAGPTARELALELAARPESGYQIVGFLPGSALAFHVQGQDAGAAPPAEENLPPGVPLLKLERSLLDLANSLRVDQIAVALEDRRSSLPMEDLLRCRMAGIVVEEGEAVFERICGKLAVSAMRPSYMIFNPGFAQNALNEASKRVLDVVFSVLLLLLLWPAMLLTALAVRLDSPGPVLFRQARVGRYGQSFTLVKFRSMRADAEAQSGPVWATADDPRITGTGRFIRKTRLDELPQLLNVLSGEMSMVGPRPEREHFVNELSTKIPFYGQRHIVKPGLTGWAQTNYPYGNTVEDARQKLQYDLFYIKNQSLIFDLSILFNTIKTVLLRKGT